MSDIMEFNTSIPHALIFSKIIDIPSSHAFIPIGAGWGIYEECEGDIDLFTRLTKLSRKD